MNGLNLWDLDFGKYLKRGQPFSSDIQLLHNTSILPFVLLGNLSDGIVWGFFHVLINTWSRLSKFICFFIVMDVGVSRNLLNANSYFIQVNEFVTYYDNFFYFWWSISLTFFKCQDSRLWVRKYHMLVQLCHLQSYCVLYIATILLHRAMSTTWSWKLNGVCVWSVDDWSISFIEGGPDSRAIFILSLGFQSIVGNNHHTWVGVLHSFESFKCQGSVSVPAYL